MLPLHMPPPPRRQSGLGLVEVMVGMLIGILGMLAMMQVLGLSETQRRTSQGSGDAQSNGMIALYGLQRDISQAGYGIGSLDLLGCDLEVRSGLTLSNLAPLTINHAAIPPGDDDTDTLLIISGNSNGATEGDRINGVTGNIYVVATPTAFNLDDWLIAARENTSQPRTVSCNLRLIQVTTAPSAAGVPVSFADSSLAQGRLYNLGQAPSLIAYAIRNGSLTRCDLQLDDCTDTGSISDTSIWVPISGNIVSLRAQYGRDAATPVSASVASPAPSYATSQFDQVAPTNECQWLRTLAVRLVLVARSVQRDGAAVTGEAPTWYASTAGNPAGSAATPIDLSATGDWQHYRYKTFQTVAPLRNITWMGVKSGC